MQEHKTFWDKNAGRYDRFMRKDRAAYEKMCALIRPVAKAKTVLELAAGTGLIAKGGFLIHRKLRPMNQNAPRGCALGAMVDGCRSNRASARESCKQDSFLKGVGR